MFKQLLKSTLFSLAILCGGSVFGQAGDYVFSVSTSTYVPLGSSATVVSELEADGGEDTVGIGFDFEFEGTLYDTVAATSDGFLSFVTGATSTAANDLDNGSAVRRPLIAPLWDDHDGRAFTSQARYEISGVAPNRVFTFEWHNWEWRYNSTDSVVSFQVKLYETTNSIEFHYNWECWSCATSPTASIGLSGSSTFLSVTGVGSGSPTASNSSEDSSIDTVVTNQVFTFTPPSCTSPTYSGASAITASSITIDWTHASASNFEVNWDVQGFTQGASSSNTSTLSTNSLTVNSLSGGTAYDFYIRTDCGAGAYSNWSGPYTVTTAFVPPFMEDWSNGYPNGWVEAQGLVNEPTVFTNTSSSSWLQDGFSNNGTTGAARINIYGTTVDEWVISPSIDLGAGTVNYQLEFDASLTVYSGSGPATLGSDDTVKVIISTDNGATWNNSDTLLVLNSSDVITNGAGNHYILDLSGYTGLVKIGFYAESTSSNADNDFFIDNVEVLEIPACPDPVALADSNITANSIDLGWQSTGSGPWYIYWGPCGFDQATPSVNVDTATTTTHTLTGLSSNMSYQYYLVERCGTDLSDSLDGGCFRTLCLKQSLPYAENFNSDAGCFSVADSGSTSDSWMWVDAGGTSNLVGDFDGTGYIIADSDLAGSGVTMNEYFVSPQIDASTLTGSLILEFDQWYNNIGGDRADVEVWDGTQWVTILSQSADVGSSFASAVHSSLDVTNYANADFQVRFHYYNAVYAWHWAIDNFSVSEVNCLASSGLSAYAVGRDSVAVNWTPADGVTFGIEYGPIGFTPGSGTLVSTTDTFYVANGLSANTSYDFYLTDTCVAGFGTTVGPITVQTLCPALSPATLPWIEDFESYSGTYNKTTNFCNTTYSMNYTNTDTTGRVRMNAGTGYAHGGVSAATMDRTPAGAVVTNSLTFTINLSNYTSSPALLLEFYYQHHGEESHPNDRVWVRGSDTDNWVEAYNLYANQGPTGTYKMVSFDIVTALTDSNQTVSGSTQIRFGQQDDNPSTSVTASDGYTFDDLMLTELPCGIASNLDTGIVTAFTAELKWSSSGSLWNIEWGPQGFTQGSGTGSNIVRGVSSNPYILTGLGPDSCYSYYVQDTCANVGSGSWVGPFDFCTPPTCPAPTNLGTDPGQITLTTAGVYWKTGGSTHWNVEYGPSGFTPGTGMKVQSTNDTLLLTSLMSGTRYDFYVRDSCSATDTSAWAGPSSFITAFNTNYLQDFAVSSPLGWTEADGRLTANTQFTSLTSSSWGSGNFGNTGSNGAQKVNIYTSNQYEWLISPSIYLDPSLTNLQVEFDAAMTGWISTTQGYFGADDSLVLVISTDNGSTWSSSDVIWYNDANDTLDVQGEHFTIPLSGYSGYVRFGFYAGSALDDPQDMDWFVDNFEVRTPRPCVNPTGLSVTSVGLDSAVVYWTEGTPGFINAEVIYTVGNQSASNGTIVNSSNDTLNLTGLNSSTNYCVYVVEQCANGYSDTLGPVCFSTLCNIQTLPYSEDFNVGLGCFTVVDSSSDPSSWMWMSNYNASSNMDGNPGFMMVDSDGAGSGIDMDEYAYSPVIDATGLSLTDSLFVEFDQYFRVWASGNVEKIDVDVFDGTSWITIYAEDQSTGTLGAWGSPDHIMLNATQYANANFQVRFHYYDANFDYWWAIDNFVVRKESFSCPSPTAVSAVVAGCDTVDVTWVSSSVTTTSSYIEYGAKGFNVGSGTVVPNVSSPYQLTGLALNTEYDLYVIDSCNVEESAPSMVASFKTDSVGPVMASFTYSQVSTTLTDADVDFDASASTGDGLSYSWDFDGSTGNGVSPQANYTGNGTYNVTLTVTDRCGNTDDTTVTITIVGISIVENDYNASLELYPNPNNGTFKVNVSEGSEFYSLEVVDLSGKVVYQRENLKPGEVHEVNLGNVADGIYMIRFRGEGLSATQRIVVE